MKRLSACLIAKNEQEFIRGCLESLAGAVDEVVVYDTGSTDATPTIAAELGARVIRGEWRDDFAWARNQALAHASGDWVLTLDCDERLAPGAGAAIRAFIDADRHEAGVIALHNADRADAAADDVLSGARRQGSAIGLLRLLCKTEDLRWENPIHEWPATWVLARRDRIQMVPGAAIVHYGATKQVVASRAKLERNARILERLTAERPDDPSAPIYHAGQELQTSNFAKADPLIEEAWRRVERSRARGDVVFCELKTVLLKLRRHLERGEHTTALALAEDTLRRGFVNPNLHFHHGVAAEACAASLEGPARHARLVEAAKAFRAAIALDGQVFQEEYDPAGTSWLGYYRLGLVLLRLSPDAARTVFLEAEGRWPERPHFTLGLAECAIDRKEPQLALEILARVPADLETPDAPTLAALATAQLGRPRDALEHVKAAAKARGAYLGPHRGARLQALVRSASGRP